MPNVHHARLARQHCGISRKLNVRSTNYYTKYICFHSQHMSNLLKNICMQSYLSMLKLEIQGMFQDDAVPSHVWWEAIRLRFQRIQLQRLGILTQAAPRERKPHAVYDGFLNNSGHSGIWIQKHKKIMTSNQVKCSEESEHAIPSQEIFLSWTGRWWTNSCQTEFNWYIVSARFLCHEDALQ